MSKAAYSPHPLNDLNDVEIAHVVNLVKESEKTKKFVFKGITMLEPAKAELAPYLEAERTGAKLPPKPARQAEVSVAFVEEPYGGAEVYVNLSEGTVKWVPIDGKHNLHIDYEEMIAAEKNLFESKMFQDALKTLKLPKGAVVVADPWIYGADSPVQVKRMIHFLCYMRDPKTNDPNSNHYALPLPIVPVMETDSMEVVRIDWVRTGDEKDGMDLTYDAEKCTDHLEANEYDPRLRNEKVREVKPLHISQPEGPSFEVNGNDVNWQKWNFRVGFNYREGLTLHNISYDGRPVMYRLSFSDMTVPYGDPRPPLHRKQAFDLGDVGAGLTANQLKLGCDCLGLIKYFDGFGILRDGTPVKQENVVCMHEQDDGLMWKHTNFRTDHAVAARSRILILQMILTVANYEYIVNWKFDQAGAIHLEIRATGILSTQPIDANKTSPYGTVVSPGVLAAHHQHIFSIRADPSVDGHNNTFAWDDVEALPFETEEDKKINPYGIGFKPVRSYLEKEGYVDASPQTSRVFKILNENKINPISKKPVGYKVYVPPTQTILAHPNSIAYKRAGFADHHVYVTKYRDQQLFAGGKYTNQSRGTQYDIKDWIKEQSPVRNSDNVLWFNYGLTHIARVEDFPIMPAEHMVLSFKPADFFTSNPTGDLPASSQDFNKSTEYKGSHRQGSAAVEEEAAAQGLAQGVNGIHINGANARANGVVNGHTNGCH